MMKKLLVFLAFCLACGPIGAAQEMPPMGAPDEMKKIAPLAGAWTAQFQFRMDPNAEFETSDAMMMVENILSGCAQRSTFKTNMMGMPFEGIAVLSFNRETGKWQNSWIDNMSASQAFSEGQMMDGKLVLEGESMYMGQTYRNRDTTHYVSDGEMHWEMETSTDGGKTWYTSMKAVYKKQ